MLIRKAPKGLSQPMKKTRKIQLKIMSSKLKRNIYTYITVLIQLKIWYLKFREKSERKRTTLLIHLKIWFKILMRKL